MMVKIVTRKGEKAFVDVKDEYLKIGFFDACFNLGEIETRDKRFVYNKTMDDGVPVFFER